MTHDQELDEFKSTINLTEYAAAIGYELDRRLSSRNSAVMRSVAGDKVVIARDFDNHWVYFSVRDETDNGSIVDFVQRRKRINLGEVRRELRPWVDGTSLPYRPSLGAFVAELSSVPRDLVAVRARWEASGATNGHHPYLEQLRGIPAALLDSGRFRDRVRIDAHGNAIFPHWNRDGICGFEIKNEGFTGFAAGGVKGLWGSKTRPADDRLVIAETAIDALSYAAIFGYARSRFLSVAGAMNDDQPKLIRNAVERMPPGSIVIAAFDNDEGGDTLLAGVRGQLRSTEIIADRPELRGRDWNDVLVDKQL